VYFKLNLVMNGTRPEFANSNVDHMLVAGLAYFGFKRQVAPRLLNFTSMQLTSSSALLCCNAWYFEALLLYARAVQFTDEGGQCPGIILSYRQRHMCVANANTLGITWSESTGKASQTSAHAFNNRDGIRALPLLYIRA
jgi:hypothetical protein